ncbi:MAG: hypothetical protein K2J15_02025 [Muribaculaceae bacterium]|nr:hypothetical protein [Muribaculaceae bacterium]
MIDRNTNTVPAPEGYRKRLGEMLDLTYELEGLLHIGVSRSSVPPRLNQLIVDKLNAIVALADEPARPEEYNAPQIMPEETDEYAEQDPETTADEDAEPAETGNYAAEYSVIAEDEGVTSEEVSSEEPAEITPDVISIESIEEDTVPMGAEDRTIDDIPEISETTPEDSIRPKGGRLFSVNDRFLYARELFGGSLKNFDKAIDGVITLDNYDEAEEYFAGEWGIDAESPTGMRFLATIMKMF